MDRLDAAQTFAPFPCGDLVWKAGHESRQRGLSMEVDILSIKSLQESVP
jgi:hypothetical protein